MEWFGHGRATVRVLDKGTFWHAKGNLTHFDMPNSDPVPQGTFVDVDELLPCSLSPFQADIPVPSPHSSGILLFKELAIFLAKWVSKEKDG